MRHYRASLPLCALIVATAASAQFRELGPAPVSPAVARQQMRTLLDKVDAGNRQETVKRLTGLAPWYRDILDDELIAAWRKAPRPSLSEVVEQLADPRTAAGIVEVSWREQRQAIFALDNAPMLGHLMARYPDSSKPFTDDLLNQTIVLSEPEIEAVCRILLDMPDVRDWRQNALQILPRYRQQAERLLQQDLQSEDAAKVTRARGWLAELAPDGVRNAFPKQAPPASPISVPSLAPPKLVYKVEPEYDEAARQARIEGTVVLKVVIDESGHVVNPQLVRSLDTALDEKALECVRKWKFAPAMKDGKPVKTFAQIQVNFHLL